ncbi:MAG: ATP-binding protein [Acidobacteriota bacterium]
MSLRQRLQAHSKDTRWIVAGLGLLLLVLSGIYVFILRSRQLPASLVTNRVLIFLLWYIDVVLIVAVFFVLLRNLLKLLVERRHRILGAKFKTKLVATYIGLSLVPVLILFVYATNLLQSAIDRWFTAPVEQVVTYGNAMAQAMTTRVQSTAMRDARRVLHDIEPSGTNAIERPQLGNRLQELRAELEADYLAVYADRQLVHGSVNPQAGMSDLPDPSKSFLIAVLRDGRAPGVIELPGPNALLAIAGVAGATGPAGRTVVVLGTRLEPEVTAGRAALIEAYQGFLQLEVQKGDLKTSHLLTFLMVTLLILLASSWTGLYLARRVTIPIQALAEGTRRIASGELGHRVETAADDELRILVDSFNQMTAELERNKAALERGNRELLEANRRLAAERALIATVLQNVAAGVISLDAEGRVFTCNGAALAMLRQSESEVLGKLAADAWRDEQRGRLAALFAAPESTAVGSLSSASSRELRMALGGEWKTFEVKVNSMLDEAGQPLGRVVVLEDLTELLQAQQIAAWSEAARRIAHEIRNPLTPIKLAAERLEQKRRNEDPGLQAAVSEAVEIIVREVEAMKHMVDEFSRFARMPRPQPEAIEVARVVDEVLHLYRGLKPGVELSAEVAANSARALLDPSQFRRALINLLDNALEATEAPGRVTVETRTLDNGSLEVRVADTGRGIPPDAREKLFRPYFSTKGRGTGLGLAIVHRIVGDHHGTIRVDDNEPQGSVFTIELPQT